MQEQTNVQQDLRLWLLGLMSQDEGELLEQRLMTDASAFDEISIVEDELIDEYIADELSEQERGAFESFFMNSSERERQFKVAKAWRSYVERRKVVPELHPSFFASLGAYRIPLAAALSILIVVAVWVAFRSTSTRPGPSLAVVLEPAVQTREGGSLTPVNLSRDIQTVELRAKLPKSEAKQYRAVLLDAGGNTVLTNDHPAVDISASESDIVVIPVPATSLTRGQYKLQLDIPHPDGRIETVATYRFVVVPS